METYLKCSTSVDPLGELARSAPHILQHNPGFIVDDAGNSVLHYLAYEDHSEEIRLLLSSPQQYLDPNIRNKNGETALHWASKMGSIRAATALVDCGINLDMQDSSGSTSLHCAVEAGIPELVPVLIGGGCNSVIPDNDGKIPLDIANENADIGSEYFAVQLLLERLTTVAVPFRETDNGSTVPDVKKGDIVFVHRKRPETVPVGNKEVSLPAASKIDPPKQDGIDLKGSDRKILAHNKQPSSLQWTSEEEAAFKDWKQKRKSQEEQRKSLKPPFYARAAMPTYPVDMSATLNTSSVRPTSAAPRLIKSSSEPQMEALSKHGLGAPKDRDPNKPLLIEQPDNLSKAFSNDPNLSNDVCFQCEDCPTETHPCIWSKILPTASLGGAVVGTTVNIDQLLDMDTPSIVRSVSSPHAKPLWWVSKDKCSHLDRSASPERMQNGMLDGGRADHGSVEPKATTSNAQIKETIYKKSDNFVAFLPSDRYARCLDVYLSVEMCHNCAEHRWLAWHDEDKYDRQASQALKTVLATISECSFPVRVFAYKVHLCTPLCCIEIICLSTL
jgi:hypothetical protein